VDREIVLISGGTRSGKSRYAEERAVGLGPRLLYLATGEAGDEEMARRIAEHKKRRGENWITVEEPLEVGKALLAHQGKIDCVVVDCLTLWVSNLLIRRGEEGVKSAVKDLVEKFTHFEFHLLLVANEVGWGIVPDNALARLFRDLAGWVNQQIGAVATEVILMVAGAPMTVKKVGRG
jgi:adenosylcobinamide kinase/adenosylcobinamide-phosphate guanylyltransferase